MTPRLLSLADAADTYALSIRTLRRLNEAGELRFYRARTTSSRLVRVAVRDMDALFGLNEAA